MSNTFSDPALEVPNTELPTLSFIYQCKKCKHTMNTHDDPRIDGEVEMCISCWLAFKDYVLIKAETGEPVYV